MWGYKYIDSNIYIKNNVGVRDIKNDVGAQMYTTRIDSNIQKIRSAD